MLDAKNILIMYFLLNQLIFTQQYSIFLHDLNNEIEHKSKASSILTVYELLQWPILSPVVAKAKKNKNLRNKFNIKTSLL